MAQQKKQKNAREDEIREHLVWPVIVALAVAAITGVGAGLWSIDVPVPLPLLLLMIGAIGGLGYLWRGRESQAVVPDVLVSSHARQLTGPRGFV